MTENNLPPLLLLSQDYELFFQESGSIEKCLFEPCDLLEAFANKRHLKFTFFVDAGMLRCMRKYAVSSQTVSSMYSKVRQHIERLSKNGHEIALHVHPHWEDTVWRNGAWDFSGTRYQFRDFSNDEITDIFQIYYDSLQDLSASPVTSYRAGGFCVEPFERIRPILLKLGVTTDSSVVPGAVLQDPAKGFDFHNAPVRPWWFFDASPGTPDDSGQFLEIPVTSQRLPVYYYWGRLADRLLARRRSAQSGDGLSKAPGKKEILRRLAGGSRVAELSIDDAKAEYLLEMKNNGTIPAVCQLMGHPKLLSARSLRILDQFLAGTAEWRNRTLASFATEIRASEQEPGGGTQAFNS